MSNFRQQPLLIDRFGRVVSYLRVSITDRCDFRCVYCMAENMTFLPRRQILSLEEIYTVCLAFVELGVTKIRITGGEPLVRRGALDLLRQLGGLSGLRELVLTTNGSHLAESARALREAGVKRINISLDTLEPAKFRALTRTGDLERVLAGLLAAKTAGFERLKLNTVVLKGRNHEEVCNLVQFAAEQGMDISFIEEMPLGNVDGHSRSESFYPGSAILRDLQQRFELHPLPETTGGPSVYYRLESGPSRVGFITPHSANFCGNCNRVRLTAEGRLLLCLGNEDAVDLKALIRQHPGNLDVLKQAIVAAMPLKPEKHHFNIHEQPIIMRHMNATGG